MKSIPNQSVASGDKTQMRATIGDIHGNFKALKQVLERSKFDYEHDQLIVLGDVCDGHAQTKECVEELLKAENLVLVLGNHDEWFIRHLNEGFADEIWIQQGGANTLRSYGAKVLEAKYVSTFSRLDLKDMIVPASHQDFFNKAVLYYELDGMVCVHGGFNPKIPISKNSKETFLWDRQLIIHAQRNSVPGWKKVFVGHTTTQLFGNRHDIKDCYVPLKFNNLIMMDTGAGWQGKLTLMDIDTKEYWQSDMIPAPVQKGSTHTIQVDRRQ